MCREYKDLRSSENHRIIEEQGLEGTLKKISLQPLPWAGPPPLCQVAPSPVQPSKDGSGTAASGNPCQGLPTLTGTGDLRKGEIGISCIGRQSLQSTIRPQKVFTFCRLNDPSSLRRLAEMVRSIRTIFIISVKFSVSSADFLTT